MPWIDTMIDEGDLQNDFLELLKEQGWKLAAHFKKVSFSDNWINPISPKLEISTIQFGIAEHFIYKAPECDVYYGIALYGEFGIKYGMLPIAVRPWTDIETIKDQDTLANRYRGKTKFKETGLYVTNKYPFTKKTGTVYMYMTERVPEDLQTNEDIVIAWNGDLKRAALDIEVLQTEYWMFEGQPSFKISESRPDFFQSPVSPVHLRIPTLEKKDEQLGVQHLVNQTNWSTDSKIKVVGRIERDHLVLIIRADAQGAFDNNRVPSIPIFWGKFKSFDPVDTGNHALQAGSAFKTDNPNFDFDDPTRFYKEEDMSLMPLLKNYIMHPSSGIDSIMVHRGKYGTRYQAHYFSWDTPSNNMPPARVGPNGGEYPDAWLQPGSLVHSYRFNPSVSTNEVDVTPAYIIHPGEGKRGWLPHVYMLNPLSMMTMDKIKVRTGACPDTFDVYRYFITGAVSPYSKRPGTAYRQAGMAIFEKAE
jgi:hypothetical protein